MNAFYEKTLEEIIFENKESIVNNGLDIFYKHSIRQLALANRNILDIFTWEVREGVFYGRVIELKRADVDERAYWQAISYYTDVNLCLWGHYKEINIEIVLIGNIVSKKVYDAQLLSNNIRLFTYNYALDGIRFSERGHSLEQAKKVIIDFTPDEDYISFHNSLKIRMEIK